MKHFLITAICIIASLSAYADIGITLVQQHVPVARIVLQDTTRTTARAAEVLNYFVKHITGTTLPIAAKAKGKNCILIGGIDASAGRDGFRIDCHKGRLTIKSGGGKGAILGVCHLVERYWGVNYLSRDTWTINHTPSTQWKEQSSLTLPDINWSDKPTFYYRQTQSYGCDDPIYRDWFGLYEPKDIFIGNLWVHTFNQILPASRFGKAHPEWYSMINGKRQPGDHSQWCLTNEALFKQVCIQLDSIFAANPGMKMISISQNDGNNTNCHCPECSKVEEEEGSPSGPIIRFLNRLAARYPDKEFSTLAYLFSMQPPRHVKPLPNVNIMLCSIDSKREVPLTDNASGREFVKALEGWSAISNNLFIWDYGINFDNVVSPFPNFHVLKPNIELFARNHAHMLFEQVNGTVGTDFAELRAYMIGKLMWNPHADADSLMRVFLEDYYGAAAPEMYRYQSRLKEELLKSKKPLWIYDSPVTHKDGMLKPELMDLYDEWFDQAEQAVANDSLRLAHVQLSRLPLQYARLEIERAMGGGDAEKIKQQVELFRKRCIAYKVPTLNERNNKPTDYCDLYLSRYLPVKRNNLALGAKVTYTLPPSKTYLPIADRALTDGIYGGTSYVEGWVGWEGKDADFTIDLGKVESVHHVSADFLHQLGAWVLLPKGVSYSYSVDGKTFLPFGKPHFFPEDRDVRVKFVEGTAETEAPVNARYIRVNVQTLGNCPAWHYGVGYPAWFFIDEVTVN